MNRENDIVRNYYNELPARVSEIRQTLRHPLTLTEKILYSHLCDRANMSDGFLRGIDYTVFAPDRVAMQDATAQMALLQFMMAGKGRSSFRSEGSPGDQQGNI
jgi:aconitate hydratase